MKKKTLNNAVCIVAALFMHGCITITNTVDSSSDPVFVAKKKVKSKARKTGTIVDYVKIQEMIAKSIAEAIAGTGVMIDIKYPEQ